MKAAKQWNSQKLKVKYVSSRSEKTITNPQYPQRSCHFAVQRALGNILRYRHITARRHFFVYSTQHRYLTTLIADEGKVMWRPWPARVPVLIADPPRRWRYDTRNNRVVVDFSVVTTPHVVPRLTSSQGSVARVEKEFRDSGRIVR